MARWSSWDTVGANVVIEPLVVVGTSSQESLPKFQTLVTSEVCRVRHSASQPSGLVRYSVSQPSGLHELQSRLSPGLSSNLLTTSVSFTLLLLHFHSVYIYMNSYTKVKQRCMFQYTHKTNNIHTYVYVHGMCVHCVPVYIKLTPITCVCVCVLDKFLYCRNCPSEGNQSNSLKIPSTTQKTLRCVCILMILKCIIELASRKCNCNVVKREIWLMDTFSVCVCVW